MTSHAISRCAYRSHGGGANHGRFKKADAVESPGSSEVFISSRGHRWVWICRVLPTLRLRTAEACGAKAAAPYLTSAALSLPHQPHRSSCIMHHGLSVVNARIGKACCLHFPSNTAFYLTIQTDSPTELTYLCQPRNE